MLKRLDRYILRGFLPILLMTFIISWFIVLMQFLWKYMDELVGKGLSIVVVVQAVFYAAMSLVPLGLSLGILFASLMYFGNMGERLELLAMKASGVPLVRIMRPLMATVALIAIGLFYFQNTYMITSQVRMWTIILSARQASPELEIPEGTFYNGITGYSIFVKQRDRNNQGRLLDVMLYDHKDGVQNARIVRADSARIVMDEGKTYLTWRLYNGQSFENLTKPTHALDERPSTYAKERFVYKEILVNFDANFRQADESEMRNRFVGKNLQELNLAIDTATMRIDSMRSDAAQHLLSTLLRERYSYHMPSVLDTTEWAAQQREKLFGSDTLTIPITPEHRLVGKSLSDSLSMLARVQQKLETLRNEIELRRDFDKGAYYDFRTNRQEWHRKFTFPVACLVFFFIGAPMGAIIRKGGLGMPVVSSVVFFLIYYIIDTFGHNMILSQKIDVVSGMWLSTLVLLPIGCFLTYQATRDSATLNTEAWLVLWRKLTGTAQVRKVEYKEVIIDEVEPAHALDRTADLYARIQNYLASSVMTGFAAKLFFIERNSEPIISLSNSLENLVELLSNSRDRIIVAKLQDMPMLPARLTPLIPSNKAAALVLLSLLPISAPIIFVTARRRKQVRQDMKTLLRLLAEISEQLGKNYTGIAPRITPNDKQ